MDHDDEELRLSPIEDEQELGLAPQEDEAAQKPIAPDLPFKRDMPLIPVTCSVCKTRMYAGERQVGLWKKCPVCESLTEIREVPPQFMLVADDPEAEGGYEVRDPELQAQDIIRLKNAIRQEKDEFIEQVGREKKGKTVDPVFIDQGPLMERVLNSFLKSGQEKSEDEVVRQREATIEQELEAFRKAKREGRMDEHLAQSAGKTENVSDPVARKLAEKQRLFELGEFQRQAQTSSKAVPPVLPFPTRAATESPPVLPDAPPSPQPPPPPPQCAPTATSLWKKPALKPPPRRPESETDRTSFLFSGTLWSPLFDPRCRPRMVILILFGLVGNFFGEKARSMIWQIMIDKVYAQTPGYSYNLAESGLFLVSFWVGAVLTVVWGTLLFLFGLSLFQETSLGKDRVDTWTPFNLDFGLSYLFWTLLILYGAGYPGCLLWWALYSSVDMSLNQFVLVSQFFCFPVLFLCVIESETFFGTWPRKTLRSLRHNPGLWLKLYGIALILTGIPSAIVVGLYRLGTLYDEHWIMHSFFYYLIASILLTFAGFFVILYFRLLGLAAREIRVVAK